MTDRPLTTTYADLFDGDDAGVALLVEDLDALYTAPLPPANMRARFDHMLRQRAQTVANGRATPVTGAIPPLSPGALPVAHPEPIPLPDRTGPRARLRQIVGIAAALFVVVLVAIMLAQLFGSTGDDNQQAAPVDATPTLRDTVGEILYVGFPENQSQERSTFALFVARSDGSGVRQITEETQALMESASWSPDGSRIVYSVIDGQQSTLYVVDADGGNARTITDVLASALSADWSPDGSRIAFVGSAPDARDSTDVYVVNADGTELQRLPESENGTDPHWSPDGSRVAFLQWRGGGSISPVVINVDGTERHRFELPLESVSYPDWSPDGSRIAFMGNTNSTDGTSSIYVIDADGSNLVRLTEGPSHWSPRWSPDGRELAFTDQNARLRLIQADGSGDRELVDGAGITPAWSPDASQIAVIVGGQLSVVNRDGSGLRALADNIISLKQQVSWRLVPAGTTASTPTTTPEPVATPAPAPSDDLAARASRSPFPDAEVLHVVQIAEQQGPDGETHVFDTWIDQVTGDIVVWHTTMDGEPRTLRVRKGTTVIAAEAGVEGWTSVTVTTMLRGDDPNLGYPLNHLHGFRDLLARGSGELKERNIMVHPDATYNGQPAVAMGMPVSDAGQVIVTVTAYLDPVTLYPIAFLRDDFEELYTYPTIEGMSLADVPAGRFDPDIPEARYTYIREAIAPEAASNFDAYPLWWLGEEFSGYALHSIERYRASGPDDIQPDRDYVTALYLGGPDDFDDQLQVISQPPLSDIDWAHRNANHNVHSYEDLEIDGNHAWLHPDRSQIEIAFPDSYVTISAPNLALAVAEALQQANAPVDTSEAAIAAAIAALPEDESGCGATPVGIRDDTGRGNQVQGRSVIGDPKSTMLLMQYSTLDDDSPRVIRVGHSILGYWVVDGQDGPLNLVSLVNLDTGLSLRPDSGPIEGQGPWRPVVWRTIITFPEPGCWQAVVTRGNGAGVIWLDVQPSMSDLAMPVTNADDFVSALTSVQPGEARRVSLSITTDLRADDGALNVWSVTIWDRALPNGREQRRMIASDSDGNPVAWFSSDGVFWQWFQRGWYETGSIAAGVVMLPEELRLADEITQVLVGVLDGSSGAQLLSEHEEGDATVSSFWLSDTPDLAERMNVRPDSITYKVWHSMNTGIPFRVATLVASPVGILSMSDVTLDVVRFPAETLDDALFELPATPALTHPYWSWSTLPRDLSIEHNGAQIGGPPIGSETLTISGDGMNRQLEVYPSRGGHDNRAMIESASQDGLPTTVTNSRVGPVTWLSRPGEGWPIRAVWDDGTYRFDLQGELRGWTENDLIALVEALSAGALR